MASLERMEGEVPWYRKPLSRRRRAALLLAVLVVGVALFLAAFQHGVRVGQHRNWGVPLATSLLPCVTSWPLLGHSSRWAPLLGLCFVTAAALLSVAGALLPVVLVLALSLLALVIPPRPNRRVIRLCVGGMAALAATSSVLGSG